MAIRTRHRAFTLLEIAIVVALLAALAALAVPTLSSMATRRHLNESAYQVRSMLYLAAAEARQQGRRIELAFVDPPAESLLPGASASAAARGVQVRVERDPLGEPNIFSNVQADWARWTVSGDKVQIVGVQVTEAVQLYSPEGEVSVGGAEDQDAGGPPPSIVFAADGRSLVGDVTIRLMNDRLDGLSVKFAAGTGQATVDASPVTDEERAAGK